MVVLLSGCGNRPPNNGGLTPEPPVAGMGEYCHPDPSFYIKYPIGFTKVSNTVGGAVFSSPENAQKNSSILTVSVSSRFMDTDYASRDELVEAVLSTLASDPYFKKLSDTTIEIDGIGARDITVSYSGEDNSMKVRFIVTDNFYKISLFSPPELFEAHNKVFSEMLKTFRFEC